MEKTSPRTPPLIRETALADASALLSHTVSCRIEEALRKVGDFGEVRLVIVKGRIRFIQIVSSESVQDA